MENKQNENIPKLKDLLTKEKVSNSNNIDKITDKIYFISYQFFLADNYFVLIIYLIYAI